MAIEEREHVVRVYAAGVGWSWRRRIVCLALLCLASGSATAQDAADLVLWNGKVFTAAPGDDAWAQAVAIAGEHILAVGADEDVRELAGPQTRLIDLGGRTVVPGLNDAHRHFPATPDGVFELELTPLEPSWEETRAAIESAAARLEPGTPIHGTVGVGVVTDPAIDRDTLDALAPDHPVTLAAFYGHGEIRNSAALRRAGLDDREPDPMGGFFERGPDGRLDGRMFEYAHWNLWARSGGRLSDERTLAVMRRLGREMLSKGITSMQNMSLLPLERYVGLLAEADLPQRVRVIRFPGTTPGGRDVALAQKFRHLPRISDRVRVEGIKWILDGTPLERGAALREPYADAPQTTGRLNFPPGEITAMLRESLDNAQQLLLHAVGDRTLEVVFDQMEAMPEVDWPSRRVRIEHGDLLTGGLVPRARRLGVVVVQNPTHFAMARFMHPRFGPDRVMGTLRTLLEAGIPVALGSDGPPEPWLDVMLAATHPTTPAEAISVEEAIRAYTLGSAFAEFREEEKGTLEPGKLADLAVLSQDVFTVPKPAIPATTSVVTIIGGEVVHGAANLGIESRFP